MARDERIYLGVCLAHGHDLIIMPAGTLVCRKCGGSPDETGRG